MEHFEKLREKFEHMKEQVEIFSRKCSFLEERLTTLNAVSSVTKRRKPTKKVRPYKPKKVRPYKPKKVVGKENSLGVYEDLVDDPTIPEGWSSAVNNNLNLDFIRENPSFLHCYICV